MSASKSEQASVRRAKAPVDGYSPERHGAAVEPANTPTQDQNLAFIYHYTMIQGVPTAEADFQRNFKVSPPFVDQMIQTLEKRGFIERRAGEDGPSRCGCPATSCRTC